MHQHGILTNAVVGIGAPLIAVGVARVEEVKLWLQVLALVLACIVSLYSIVSLHIKVKAQRKNKDNE